MPIFFQQVGHITVGNIVLEVNNIPVHSADDLSALVALSDKSVQFLIKRIPEKDLKRYGIPATPSLRKQLNEKTPPEARVLCHVRALFDYDPYQDNLVPCADAALAFSRGDVLAVVNQDDPNWWQAVPVAFPGEPARLVPSQELEERRQAFVPPEADYTTKVGLCGSLVSRKKRKQLFTSKQNASYDKAELLLYEEVRYGDKNLGVKFVAVSEILTLEIYLLFSLFYSKMSSVLRKLSKLLKQLKQRILPNPRNRSYR